MPSPSLEDAMDFEFLWELSHTRDENYHRWRELNNAERDAWDLPRETESGARWIFDKMEVKWRAEADHKRNDPSWHLRRFSSSRTESSI